MNAAGVWKAWAGPLVLLTVAGGIIAAGLTHRPVETGAGGAPDLQRENRFAPLVERLQRLESAQSDGSERLWSVPGAQSTDGLWLYDVFTPPRIYIHPQSGDFEPTPYQFEKLPVVPNLRLLSSVQPLFEVQLVGFVENSLADTADVTLLVEAVNTGQTRRIRFRAGEQLGDGMQMQSFEITRRQTEAGALVREGRLLVAERNGGIVELLTSKPTFRACRTFVLDLNGTRMELSAERPRASIEGFEVEYLPAFDTQDRVHFRVTELESRSEHPFILSNPNSFPP